MLPLVVVAVVEEDGAAHSTGATPLPVRLTDWGDPGAPSEMESCALSDTYAEGWKLIFKEQLVPAATVGHCPGAAMKSAALVPVTDMAVMLSGCWPVFAMAIG